MPITILFRETMVKPYVLNCLGYLWQDGGFFGVSGLFRNVCYTIYYNIIRVYSISTPRYFPMYFI